MVPVARRFTFDGRHAFLTYPQCGDLTRERVRDFLVGELGCRRFLVARELHSDGQPHIHAFCAWDTRRRLVGERTFDVDGRHPNVQIPRSTRDVARYVAKHDVEALRNFEPDELDTDNSRTGWGSILREATGRDDFLARVRENYPRDFALHYQRLEYLCERLWGEGPAVYSGRIRSDFTEPLELHEWVRLSLEVC